MSEVKKCPKCGNEMEEADKIVGYGLAAIHILKKGDLSGDKVVPFYCHNCGYIELYNEKSLKMSLGKR